MNRPMRLMAVGPLLVLLAGVAAGQNQRYEDQQDGTVKDTGSGLVWLADANCFAPMPWRRAKARVARLRDGMCGLTDGSRPGDWRLPTMKEWEMTIECSCGDIVLTDDTGRFCYSDRESTIHDVQASDYWSSTVSTRGNTVRVMSLFDGLVSRSRPGASLLVWPVRND